MGLSLDTEIARAKDLLNRSFTANLSESLSIDEGRELDALWIKLRIDNNEELKEELDKFYERSNAAFSSAFGPAEHLTGDN